MATWSSDNVILTEIGQQILSKVQAGVGAITVTRIVTGGTIIPYAQLYKATSIPDIKQECTIISVNTDMKGSEISVSVSNEALEESYSLYTLGIYVTHPDFEGEQLYLVAECDTSNPDVVPIPSVTVATLYYSLYMVHNNTDQIIINVDTSGSLPLTGGTITGDLHVTGPLTVGEATADTSHVTNKRYVDNKNYVKNLQGNNYKFWSGSQEEYSQLGSKDQNTLYILTNGFIYQGEHKLVPDTSYEEAKKYGFTGTEVEFYTAINSLVESSGNDGGKVFTATIQSVSEWNESDDYFYINIPVEGIKETHSGVVGFVTTGVPDSDNSIAESYDKVVYDVKSFDGYIQVRNYSNDKADVDIPLLLICVGGD